MSSSLQLHLLPRQRSIRPPPDNLWFKFLDHVRLYTCVRGAGAMSSSREAVENVALYKYYCQRESASETPGSRQRFVPTGRDNVSHQRGKLLERAKLDSAVSPGRWDLRGQLPGNGPDRGIAIRRR